MTVQTLTARPLTQRPQVAATATLPPVMEQALTEFGLTRAFRVRPPARQRHYARWVAASRSDAIQRNRIASILDELAIGPAV